MGIEKFMIFDRNLTPILQGSECQKSYICNLRLLVSKVNVQHQFCLSNFPIFLNIFLLGNRKIFFCQLFKKSFSHHLISFNQVFNVFILKILKIQMADRRTSMINFTIEDKTPCKSLKTEQNFLSDSKEIFSKIFQSLRYQLKGHTILPQQ